MNATWRTRLAGGAAGLANGLFGGGGGMVLVPMLSHRLEQRQLYATCVGVIFPMCIVSSAVYFFRTNLSFFTALPYLLGGFLGGFLGGKVYGAVSTGWLKCLFAGFLFYAGGKYLLC